MSAIVTESNSVRTKYRWKYRRYYHCKTQAQHI